MTARAERQTRATHPRLDLSHGTCVTRLQSEPQKRNAPPEGDAFDARYAPTSLLKRVRKATVERATTWIGVAIVVAELMTTHDFDAQRRILVEQIQNT